MILKQKFLSKILIISIVFGSFLQTSTVLAADAIFSFAKAIGGTGYDEAYNGFVDSNGNSYTTGYFEGTVDFDPGAGTANLTSAGDGDIFILKLDSSGNFVFAKAMGGTSSDSPNAITLDSSGNIYVLGTFQGTADFDPGAGTANLTSAGSSDTFIAKLDSSGNYVFAKRMGGTSNESPAGIAVDSSGNIYTTGAFNGTADFDPGAGTSNLVSTGGTNDIFVSKLDSSGNFVWAKRMGGADSDYGNAIMVDSSGNVYTVGSFIDTVDFDPGAGTSNLVSASAGYLDVFISKLDSSGAFVWAKQMGGNDNDTGSVLNFDSSSNLYVSGNFAGTSDFDPGVGTSNLTSVGGNDVFISKLDSSGNFVWAKQMGGSGNDGLLSTVLDSNGNIYTTGIFRGTADFDPGVGTANLTSVGDPEVFISILDSSGSYVLAKKVGGTGFEYVYSINLDSSNSIYIIGYFEQVFDADPGTGTSNLVPPSAGSGDAFILKLSQTSAPTLSTVAASSLSFTEAILNGTISSIGGVTVTSRGFQYGLSGALDHTIEQAGSYSTGSFSSSLTNLDCGKTYSFRSYATNTEGTSYGSTTTFSTTDCPGVVALPSFNTGGGSSSSNIPPITPISPIDPISPTTPTQETQYPTNTFTNQQLGRSVKLINLPAVYYINTYNKKLIYPNWLSFLSYNKSPQDIQTITKQELDSYPTIQYIKSDPNGIVYKLTNVTKQALTQAACDRLKVLPDDVLLISQTQIDSYKKGSNILK